jgi:hypothetical protein
MLLRNYKWLAREIDSLRPDTDYARIWALTVTYRVNDFMMNAVYTLGLQCFTQSPAASELMAFTTRTAILRKQQRNADTMKHFWKWFESGTSHPKSQRSIEVVNRIHASLAAYSPGTFPPSEIIYTCAWIGVFFHRLQRSLGLAGFTRNQKIAAHKYWEEFAGRLWSGEGEPARFPATFAGMLECVQDYESRPWPMVDSGRILASALTGQFAEAWFPRPFQWVGRQIILSLQHESVRKLMQMDEPNPVVRRLIRSGLFALFWAQSYLLPDPVLSTPEKARRKVKVPDQHRDPGI